MTKVEKIAEKVRRVLTSHPTADEVRLRWPSGVKNCGYLVEPCTVSELRLLAEFAAQKGKKK